MRCAALGLLLFVVQSPLAHGRVEDPAAAATARVSELQGAGHRSPRAGDEVTATGIVTLVLAEGFFLQDAAGDGDPDTSDGVFVATAGAVGVRAGEVVVVTGQVIEHAATAAPTVLSETRIVAPAPPRAAAGSHGAHAVAPVRLGPGGRTVPRPVIDDDELERFEPHRDAIDFFESLEGMRVRIEDARVVQGTSAGGREVHVTPRGGHGGLENERGGLTAAPGDFHPEIVAVAGVNGFRIPAADAGDRFPLLEGVLAQGAGGYRLLVESCAEPQRARLGREATLLSPADGRWTIATFNVENLSRVPDGGAASGAEIEARIGRVARRIVESLGAPEIVALQEMGDDDGVPAAGEAADPAADPAIRGAGAAREAGSPAGAGTFEALVAALNRLDGGQRYDFAQIDPEWSGADGGQPGRNIRVGFLFRIDRGVELVKTRRGAGGPADPATLQGGALERNPARLAPGEPAFASSRKPLLGWFRKGGRDLFVVNCHLESKWGDDPLFGARQPPVEASAPGRLAQARAVADFVKRLRAGRANAAVVVVGDLNDFPFSPAVLALSRGAGLANLHDLLPAAERYTYLYRGNSQALDHILVTPDLLPGAEVDVVHLNAEFHGDDPQRVSDHDPVVARLIMIP